MLIHPEAVEDTLRLDGIFLDKLSDQFNIRIEYLNSKGEQLGPDAKLSLTNGYYLELKRRVDNTIISDVCKGKCKFPFKTLQFPDSNLNQAEDNNRTSKTFFIQYDNKMDGYFEVLGTNLLKYGIRSTYYDRTAKININCITIDMKYVNVVKFER